MAVSSNSGLLDFKTLLVPVIRAKTFLIVFVVFGVCLGIAHFLWASPEYKAKLVIIPEFDSGSSLLSGASDLAMMAGIRLGGDSEPTLYYKEILLSDLILDRVLHETYGNTDQPLLVALGFGKNLAEVEKAIRHLRKTTTVVRNNRTGIITMSVRSQDLVLSRSLANEMAKALDQFLLQSQSKTAGNQFDFLSQEIKRADSLLDLAEKDLSKFKIHNRMTLESPDLQREQSRLHREVVIREVVLVELRKQAEILKISTNKQVSKIQLLEPARSYHEPVYPILFQSLFVGILLMGIIALAIIYSRAYLLPIVLDQIQDA